MNINKAELGVLRDFSVANHCERKRRLQKMILIFDACICFWMKLEKYLLEQLI
jgi:hypothetical protein